MKREGREFLLYEQEGPWTRIIHFIREPYILYHEDCVYNPLDVQLYCTGVFLCFWGV